MTTKARRHRGRAQRHINRGTTPKPGTSVHHHYQAIKNPWYGLKHAIYNALIRPFIECDWTLLYKPRHIAKLPKHPIHNGKANRR